MKLKLGFRIWLLIIILIFSLISIINFSGIFTKGVLIESVESNSTAFEQGLRQNRIITAIDGKQITSMEEFTNALQGKYGSNESVKTIFKVDGSDIILFSKEAPDITVSDIPKTAIKTGLDLSGGARALVKAEDTELTSAEINDLVEITRNRLNAFGLTDLEVRPVSDLEGHHYMSIEIAGATPEDLEKIISEQGKFEAKIGDIVVFEGGKEKGISSVGRSGQDAYVETPQRTSDGTYIANFRFSVVLNQEAAKAFANATKDLDVNASNTEALEKPIDFYLDGNLVDSLSISAGLKGRVETQISITGSGSGATEEDAYNKAQEEMKHLQTVLLTGSLPYKLEIVKLDTISPALGKDFVRFIIFAGIAALLAASIVVFVRYRNFKSSLMVILFSFSEVVIILGVASLIEWNLDLASIAGILATIGTGFDDQIVILDEARQKTILSLKQRIKRAFAIIMGAYFTALVSLLPLIWAGAGLFKGFAITTIIGISIGVFITRPAFSEVIRRIGE